MGKKYNQKEQVLRYIVALTEIKKNYIKYGKFWHLSESTQKQGIGTIPKDCLFDLIDQSEITESYVFIVLKRRIDHDIEVKKNRQHKKSISQTLFDANYLNPNEDQVKSEQAPVFDLTEEICIDFLRGKGYQIYKRYC